MIAAYNEEKVIQEKLDNALALNYPADGEVASHAAFIMTARFGFDVSLGMSVSRGTTDFEVTPHGTAV
jgi:cellulose synthase/poly-beta-1,6-N-acetylglucosamine synthase-like glycosyltransferase